MLEPDLSVMGMNDILRNKKTEAGSVRFDCYGVFCAEKASEDLLCRRIGDTNAIVLDLYMQVIFLNLCVERDRIFHPRVFDRVADKILEHIAHFLGINFPFRQWMLRCDKIQTDLFRFCNKSKALDRLFDQELDMNGNKMVRKFTRFNAAPVNYL